MTSPANKVMEKMGDALGVFPDGDLAVIMRTFDLMEIAEDEIGRGMDLHPGKAAEITDCFTFARPTKYLLNTGTHLYRAHVRELVERVANGVELTLGTDAELVGMMSQLSLEAGGPLTRSATGMMLRVFHRLFPDFTFDIAIDDLMPDRYFEDWPGQMDELEAKARAKIASTWRVKETATQSSLFDD